MAAGGACRACGGAIPSRPAWRDTCAACGAWLHACLNCAHYDRDAYRQCRASASAEFVSDKEKYNFCEEYTIARASGGGTGPAKSREDVEKLFPDPS